MTEWIEDASVEIKGKDRNGTPISVTGDIENFRVEHDVSHEEYHGKIFTLSDNYYLKFKRKADGTAYKVKLKTTTVERTAEIEVPGCTPRFIEAARLAVGAPQDAGVRPLGAGYWPEAVRINLAGDKVKLMFVWTEEVVLK